MNRAEQRRQQRLSKKKQPSAAADGPPAGNASEIQQVLTLAVQHHTSGRLFEAEALYQQILQTDPNHPDALHLLGLIAHQVGKNEIAVEFITKAIAIKPDFAELHSNLGLALQNLGKLDEAVASFQKALTIKPDLAEVHNNLGLGLMGLGELEKAVTSYQTALTINPEYPEANTNLGNALRMQGKLDEAVAYYQKAIAIRPDYAVALNNLGVAFQILGLMEEAAASFEKAIAIEPGFAEAYYNLHALLLDHGDLATAIKYMEKTVEINPGEKKYRFALGMLLDYFGNSDAAALHFDLVENGENIDRATLDAWSYIKSAHKKIPTITGTSIRTFKHGFDSAVNEGLVLEFGVRSGTSIRQIAVLAEQEVHGFDSFEGLPEAWHDEPKGTYTTKGVVPIVPKNVILHKGWFEDILPGFVEKHQAPVRFMNIDCDIYSSTKTILELFAGQIFPGTVIVFDEYIGNEKWREDEFKAFQEAVLKYDWKYEYLCFSFMTKQVVIRIT